MSKQAKRTILTPDKSANNQSDEQTAQKKPRLKNKGKTSDDPNLTATLRMNKNSRMFHLPKKLK